LVKHQGGLRQPATLSVLDIGQADQPTFRRKQQAGRFLSRCQIEKDATKHALGIMVGMAPPDLRLSAQLQRQVEQTILEIFDARAVGKPAPVKNGDAHGRILAS
jgi:hypothetical protein